jgi:hypothetical protein
MYWNHRVVKHNGPGGSVWYQIHEAYYNEGKPADSITHDAIAPGGETIEELAEELRRMLKATEKPSLNYTDF